MQAERPGCTQVHQTTVFFMFPFLGGSTVPVVALPFDQQGANRRLQTMCMCL